MSGNVENMSVWLSALLFHEKEIYPYLFRIETLTGSDYTPLGKERR